MLWHSVHSHTFRRGIPEPSLEGSVICTLLFYYTVSGRNRMTAMAKVRLLAVLTMDGCPAETTGLSGRWLGSDQYGIGALKEAATCVLTEDMSLTLLSSRTENIPPTGGDVRKMNARDVQKVNVRSDSEQKMRRRKKLPKIFSANITLNISVIYPYGKKNNPAGAQFVP